MWTPKFTMVAAVGRREQDHRKDGKEALIMKTEQDAYDSVVIGGGAAGLSGALALARSRRSVLVVDAGEPRNAAADGVHNYLGLEGTPPLDLLGRGIEEVRGYGGEVVQDRVVSAQSLASGFRLTLRKTGPVLARRLLVATGLIDDLPPVEGLAERWGRDVLHCPYCHGWEVRDQAIGVLGAGPMSIHQALLFRQLSANVTYLVHTGAEPNAEESRRLAARDIIVVRGRVESLDVTDDRLTGVALDDGLVMPLDALTVGAPFTPRLSGLEGIGLEMQDFTMGDTVLGAHLPVDAAGATAVEGVYAAGNVCDPHATVIGAAAAGLNAAAAINAELVSEDIRLAVAQRDVARG